MLRVDHVVFAVRDLDEAAARFLDRDGLVTLPGGVHPRWGTANRIAPLGTAYVELIGVLDASLTASHPFGVSLLERTRRGDGWFTWCVADDDLDATGRRLGLEVEAGSRLQPDGEVLAWRNAGIDDPRRTPDLPFFIAWDVDPARHPGAATVRHPCGATGLAKIETSGERATFDAWTGGAELPITVVAGGPALRSVTLATPAGDLTIA